MLVSSSSYVLYSTFRTNKKKSARSVALTRSLQFPRRGFLQQHEVRLHRTSRALMSFSNVFFSRWLVFKSLGVLGGSGFLGGLELAAMECCPFLVRRNGELSYFLPSRFHSAPSVLSPVLLCTISRRRCAAFFTLLPFAAHQFRAL